MTAYATVALVAYPNMPEFEPGDRLDDHFTPEAIEKLIRAGYASHERPEVTPVYCAVENLTHGHHGFRRGDRIDHRIHRALLRDLIARGEAVEG